MKKAYLSIDLDFWMNEPDTKKANQFFNKVFALNVPKKFVIEHEELVDDINKSKADILYNMDFHSDICGDSQIQEGEDPEDGTWVNFISWSNKGKYIWICPDVEECYELMAGTCHGEEEFDPFKFPIEHSWNSIQVTQRLKIIDWRKVTHIGICLSPCYISANSVKDITKKLGLSKNKLYNLIKEQPLFDPKNRHRGILSEEAA